MKQQGGWSAERMAEGRMKEEIFRISIPPAQFFNQLQNKFKLYRYPPPIASSIPPHLQLHMGELETSREAN